MTGRITSRSPVAPVTMRVMAGTSTLDKHRWRFAAYVVTTLRLVPEMRSIQHLITVDGVEYEAQATMVLIANCGEVIPPFVRLRTGISPHDGLLDVVVVRADSFVEGVRAIWELLREGVPAGSEGRIGYAQGREIRVETTPAEPVQMDGEPGGETPFVRNRGTWSCSGSRSTTFVSVGAGSGPGIASVTRKRIFEPSSYQGHGPQGHPSDGSR